MLRFRCQGQHPLQIRQQSLLLEATQHRLFIDCLFSPVLSKSEKEFYTARYWPSLDSSVTLSKALKHLSISVDRLFRLYGILKPASRLAQVKATLRC